MALSGFSGRSLPLGEFHLITAERRMGDGHRIIEAFLLFPKARAPYYSASFRFSWGAAGPRPEIVADVDMPEMARQWALGIIDEEILHWVQSQERPTSLPDLPILAAGDAETILKGLHFRRLMTDDVQRIGYQSQDTELRALIDRVCQFPRIYVGAVDQ